MSDENWNYGARPGVRPNMARGIGSATVPSAPPTRPSKPVTLGNSRVIFGVIGLLIVGGIVFAFMRFVGKSGSEVAQTEQQTIQRGQDVQPQVDLQNALVAAKSSFIGDQSSYQGVNAASLSQAEPALRLTDGASTKPGLISVFANGNSFGAAEISSSGACFYVRDVVGQGTTYGKSSGGSCAGRDALIKATSPSW